jgi:hypothetical protein
MNSGLNWLDNHNSVPRMNLPIRISPNIAWRSARIVVNLHPRGLDQPQRDRGRNAGGL